MRLLEAVEATAAHDPRSRAVCTSEGACMSYGQLWDASEAIARLVGDALGAGSDPVPVAVWGNKDPLMLACFLGCMKAGCPYVPLDCHSVPPERARGIIEQLGDPLVLAVDELAQPLPNAARIFARPELERAVAAGGASRRERWIAGEDLCYILFTSGSTGAPKGVEVTAACVDNFATWCLRLGGLDKRGLVFLDQAPFSFDLSVFEIAGALMAGGSLFSLTHATQQSAAARERALASSGVNVWVSTPSFAELCLSDRSFSAELLPDLALFIFCGETLANATALALLDRFPGARVLNTYGPTESTVAVTEVTVTREMAEASAPLPVGTPRPGTRLRIRDASGRDCAPGERGEVIIEGDTVARGYFGRPDLTERAFGRVEVAGRPVRTYRTGDEGYLDADGMLHFGGRLDLQVKLNGFRIELGEIEERLRRLPGVHAAAVVALEREGRAYALVAHVVADEPEEPLTDFRRGLALKQALKESLPHYMIPKKVVFHSALPMTGNGKIDRRALVAASGL